MSSFDVSTNAPGALRSEALGMNIKFDRTGPSTGRVSWNIPVPAAGCAADSQAYCGILVTLDTAPTAVGTAPEVGKIYSSDPTGDTSLFAGDKLGTASVVGAFYQNKTTTFFDVSGLQANTPYYISGFPTDCQLNYFIEGIHTYSLQLANKGSEDTSGTQVVVLNPKAPTMGAHLSDPTGLLVGEQYKFKIQVGIIPKSNRPVDSVECHPNPATYTITIDGTSAQTLDDLIRAINKQFSLQGVTVLQSPTPPNTGTYYWNTSKQQLFLWNGFIHQQLDVIVQSTAPSVVTIGTYWCDTTTDLLKLWNGSAWIAVSVLMFDTDPTQPLADKTIWFNGTNSFLWNGSTWCPIALSISSTDPSLPPTISLGSYWLNSSTNVLKRWNGTTKSWDSALAVKSVQDPNQLNPGSHWFDEIFQQLYTLDLPSTGWNLENNVSITPNAPATPAPGKFWFNPETKVLKQWDSINVVWNILDVISFQHDPKVRTACDLWINPTTNILSAWDSINRVWQVVPNLIVQSNNPAIPVLPTEGSTWYNQLTNTLYTWVNNCFKQSSFIFSSTDPTNISIGTVWKDNTGKYRIRSTTGWEVISPTSSKIDPTLLLVGTLWFNSATSSLQQWNGVTWVAIGFSTSPLTPIKGTKWFDTTNNLLKVWNGTTWGKAIPFATVELDCNGNLLFTDTTKGSTSFVLLTDINLFSSLTIPNTIHDPKPGTDGVSGTPTYLELGVGTDGSLAARQALGNDIRTELGYPVVDVELTPAQIDYALSKALRYLRQHSGISYRRGFFFMGIKAQEQRYFLTNQISGMNKIVDILGVYRITSSFLSSAYGGGVYGQIIVQQMYTMGSLDLLSFHLTAEYSKLMELLFAARITYNWNEQTREIMLHHRFPQNERAVCIEATVERTEQDLMLDRYAGEWIRKYATATCRLMLAEIRGKFSSLPGAGGSITLNADALRQAANSEIEVCEAEIRDYVVDRVEEWGSGSSVVFG
jgi:hypothetical protein